MSSVLHTILSTRPRTLVVWCIVMPIARKAITLIRFSFHAVTSSKTQRKKTAVPLHINNKQNVTASVLDSREARDGLHIGIHTGNLPIIWTDQHSSQVMSTTNVRHISLKYITSGTQIIQVGDFTFIFNSFTCN